MAISLKYQGQEKARSRNEASFKETYQGTEAEVDAYISNLPEISTGVEGKGYLTSWRKFNAEGPIWCVEIEYTTSYDDFNNEDTQLYGKKSAQLSVRNIQMPLESHSNYLAKWNHYLIALGTDTVPNFWNTAKNTTLTSEESKTYKWIKSISEMPTEPDAEGKYWNVIKEPTKPGVDYYDMSCFVVTESAKFKSATSAGNAVSKNINKIISPDNTFGITGGNWKYDEASISFNGKYWVATSVYTRSGDDKGWDVDIYQNG